MFDGAEEIEIDREYEELCATRERAAREKDLVRLLFEAQPRESPRVPGDPLDAYLQAVLERTRRDVTQLEEEIEVRRGVHEQSVAQLDYEITAAAHSLSRFANGGLGYNRGVDQKRAQLEDRLDALRREKRLWRVRVWRDLVDLRAQLRHARREYEAALRRARLSLG